MAVVAEDAAEAAVVSVTAPVTAAVGVIVAVVHRVVDPLAFVEVAGRGCGRDAAVQVDAVDLAASEGGRVCQIRRVEDGTGVMSKV